MSGSPSGPHAIRTVRQLRALRSPVRHQILGAMERRGPCSVGELAAETGRPAESLYYHVKGLAAAGLVLEKRKRPAGRRMESVYELVSREITVDPLARSPAFLRALAAVYSSALRAADRNLSRALELEKDRKRGPRTTAAVRQWTARLDEKGIRKLRRMLGELGTFLEKHEEPGAGRACSLTVALSLLPTPTERSRRRPSL